MDIENVDLIDAWHDLYVMLGGSSAALVGLLFVAASIHLGEVVTNPGFRVRAYNQTQRAQYEVVCVLSLLALATQKYLFWIAALLLALIKLPDFSKDPIRRIAGSIEKGAGLKPGEGASYPRRALKPRADSIQMPPVKEDEETAHKAR